MFRLSLSPQFSPGTTPASPPLLRTSSPLSSRPCSKAARMRPLPPPSSLLNSPLSAHAFFLRDATKTVFKSSTRLECMMQDYPKALPQGAAVGFTTVNQVRPPTSLTCYGAGRCVHTFLPRFSPQTRLTLHNPPHTHRCGPHTLLSRIRWRTRRPRSKRGRPRTAQHPVGRRMCMWTCHSATSDATAR